MCFLGDKHFKFASLSHGCPNKKKKKNLFLTVSLLIKNFEVVSSVPTLSSLQKSVYYNRFLSPFSYFKETSRMWLTRHRLVFVKTSLEGTVKQL